MTATNRQRVADGRWKYWSEKLYKIQINKDDSEAIIYYPTPLVKWFFSCLILASNCWNNIYIRKLLKFVPPPLQEISRCRVAKLWCVEITGTTRSANKYQVFVTLPVGLLDLYVSSVVWICTYDLSSLFQKNKTVTVMWCDYTLAVVNLILYALNLGLVISFTRVIAFALIRICCLGGCL